MGDLLQTADICIPHSDSSQRQEKERTITTSAQFFALRSSFIFVQIQHPLKKHYVNNSC